MIRIGINGFGRIGRAFLRKVIDNPAFKVVAINDPAQTEVLLHLLKYDSVHGKFGIPFSQNADAVKIGSNEILFYHLVLIILLIFLSFLTLYYMELLDMIP